MSLGNNLCQDDELEKYSQHVLNTVSKNVAKYRKEKGFTQMQLALEIGMSGGAYLGRAEIRKHDHHFNLKHLAKISKVLEIDIGEFFK
ncbi:MAG: helix-turn-helix transcriptional regulator [Epsilonproteobacteria bacterium]|nr:helix-turn-helix transcriptional regulator [Campylobacterota bacterium]